MISFDVTLEIFSNIQKGDALKIRKDHIEESTMESHGTKLK